MAARCGLLIERTENREPIPVPLTGVSVEARIVDLVAEVTIEQRYVNKENQPIEAVYLFPLDEGAGVCKFTAEVDGRLIEGVVKETEEARVDYEQAIQSGHSAFLVEEKLPDVFKAKVGNLAAGSGAKIRLTYVTELKVEGGEVRFYLPTTIAPRYIPPSDNSSAAADLAKINYTMESHYQVDFSATVQMASAIKEIRSPTHKISVNHDAVTNPMIGNLRLEDVVACLDRDLVLYIQVAEPNEPRLLYEKSPSGSAAMMLSLVPSFKLVEQKTELIFLVDRSGSMQGAGIEQARQALKLFLHSLPLDCYVNIAGFGFTYEELFPASRKYDEVVLTNAKVYAEALQANLGGTEIFNPLQQIFEKPPIDGYLRQVFVLTDGEVSNADQVLSLVRNHSGQSRVFALGLGSSASHHLVEGMARAGNGTALFASLEERLEKKVMQQLQDALQPALTDVKIHWEGYDETEQPAAAKVNVQTEMTLMGYGKPLAEPGASKPVTETPAETTETKKLRQAPCDKMIPPVFDGRHLVVYALLAKEAHLPKLAEVTAKSPVGPLSLKVNLKETNSGENQLVHRLAAKKLIQLLQDREEQSDVKKEIIQLGCEYGLASKFTSYVAVDPKEQTELKESWMMMKSRDVPVQVAHAWGGRLQLLSTPLGCGYRSPMSGAVPQMMALSAQPPPPPLPMPGCVAPPPPMMAMANSAMGFMHRTHQPMSADSLSSSPPMALGYAAPPPPMMMRTAKRSNTALVVCLDSAPMPAPMPALMPECEDDSGQKQESNVQGMTDDDKLIMLVSTQNFDGSFKMESILGQLLDTTIDDMREAGQKNSYNEQVWATAIALAYLSLVLNNIQSSWMLVGKKAENWLHAQQLMDASACTKAAQEFVKEKLHL